MCKDIDDDTYIIHTFPNAINARSKNSKTPRNRKKAPNPVNAKPISIYHAWCDMRYIAISTKCINLIVINFDSVTLETW